MSLPHCHQVECQVSTSTCRGISPCAWRSRCSDDRLATPTTWCCRCACGLSRRGYQTTGAAGLPSHGSPSHHDTALQDDSPSHKDWIGLCSVLRPRKHSIGYMGDGFYRSKDPTNNIKVLKQKAVKEKNPKNRKKTKNTHMHTHTK